MLASEEDLLFPIGFRQVFCIIVFPFMPGEILRFKSPTTWFESFSGEQILLVKKCAPVGSNVLSL